MYLVILMSVSVHSCYLGSKVVVSLLALELGASQFTVGIIAAFYALVPLLLGVYSGRLADRTGMRAPMLVGATCTGLAMLSGFMFPTLAGLFGVSLLMGAGFVLFNVSIQNLAGSLGTPQSRARNFSLLSIGYSVSAFFGPTFGGFSIDYAGHAATFGFFAMFTLVPIAVLTFNDRVTRVAAHTGAPDERSTLALLADGPLRRIIITSGLAVAANELFAFYLPVYAHSIGLSASTTGVVLGTYAAAAFVTRFMLPLLLRRLGTVRVMVNFMLLAAAAFAVLPFTQQAPVLMAIAFVIGIGLGVAQPVLMTVSYERSPPGRTGEVTGLRLTANNVARVTIPLISGALGALLGAAPVFLLNALNLAAVSYLSRK